MRSCFRVLCVLTVLSASIVTSVFANNLPDVSNVRAEGSTIVWDSLPGAAGYNIYAGAMLGSQQGQFGFQYETTVRNSTSFQPSESFRIYKVVAFSEGGAAFGSVVTAPSAYVSELVTEDTDSVDVVFYNDSIGRYLVTNTCSASNECAARCDHNANAGNATGGFCSTTLEVTVSSFGTKLTYQCAAVNGSGPATLTAGVYCAP